MYLPPDACSCEPTVALPDRFADSASNKMALEAAFDLMLIDTKTMAAITITARAIIIIFLRFEDDLLLMFSMLSTLFLVNDYNFATKLVFAFVGNYIVRTG